MHLTSKQERKEKEYLMPGAGAHGGTLSHAAVGFPTLQWGFPHCSGNVYSHKP